MRQICMFLFVLSLVPAKLHSQNGKFFPTGMKWQEATVEMGAFNMDCSHTYEIGPDKCINDVVYKEVFVDEKPADLWLREENGIVWLLSDENQQEIKLYDFNWDDSAVFLYTEYLQENGDGFDIKSMKSPTAYRSISVDGRIYQYHQEGEGIVIRNIGRVYELNLNSCLLGYKLSETILPGLIYWKVLWIEKGGDVVFLSDSPEEWRLSWASSQEDFPEGTRWTEIRLDTLKYDSWYSKVGDEWVPNYETIEYYVKGEFIEKRWDFFNSFKKVYTNGPEWTDSLTFLIRETDDYGYNCVMGSALFHDYNGESYMLSPGEAYQFDWSVGKGLYYQDLETANTTSLVRVHYYYGIIDEIKEGYFGVVKPLKYVDLDGKAPDDEGNIKNVCTNGGRIIQGIGITEWNDGECLFGPLNIYSALQQYDSYHWELYPERHYRSMLVRFERNGEVLYDAWPENGAINEIRSISKVKTPYSNTLYDLQGRKLRCMQHKGIYIQNGKKIIHK